MQRLAVLFGVLCFVCLAVFSISCNPASPSDGGTTGADVAQGQLYVDIYDSSQTRE